MFTKMTDKGFKRKSEMFVSILGVGYQYGFLCHTGVFLLILHLFVALDAEVFLVLAFSIFTQILL